MLLGGENRIILPLYAYSIVIATPSLILAWLVMHDTMSHRVKQMMSIPLLAALFLTPFGFHHGNKLVDLLGTAGNYNLFLRFLELFWVGPLVQNRPVYTTVADLWIEFWGCLRVFPKPATKGQVVKQYQKDKKFHHLIFYLLGHLLVSDIVATWVTSFTGHELVAMHSERPVTFFFFFFAGNILLNCILNTIGYSLQLFYCIFMEKGTYSSEQWRPLMINPICSTSLNNLWSHRWHQLFRSTWLAFPFRPVRILTMRLLRTKRAEPVALLLASLSVFLVSALMHEYVLATNMGWSMYTRFFKGEQCIFFISQGLGIMFEQVVATLIAPRLSKEFKASLTCRAIQRAWMIGFCYFTFYYIMHGFMTWGFQFDNPLQYTRPWILDHVRVRPALLSYFGSHVY